MHAAYVAFTREAHPIQCYRAWLANFFINLFMASVLHDFMWSDAIQDVKRHVGDLVPQRVILGALSPQIDDQNSDENACLLLVGMSHSMIICAIFISNIRRLYLCPPGSIFSMLISGSFQLQAQ